MKMVHLISWKEYQEILIKIRLGENVGDLPAPDLFEVKNKSLICLSHDIFFKKEYPALFCSAQFVG